MRTKTGYRRLLCCVVVSLQNVFLHVGIICRALFVITKASEVVKKETKLQLDQKSPSFVRLLR